MHMVPIPLARQLPARILVIPLTCLSLRTTALGQTVITTGTTVTVPNAAAIGPTLTFGTGPAFPSTSYARLAVTSGASSFTGTWSVNGVATYFSIAPGVQFAIQPSGVGTYIPDPLSVPRLEVDGGGSLYLGLGSFLPDMALGGVRSQISVLGSTELGIADSRWLTNANVISLGNNGDASTRPTLHYLDTVAATYSGSIDIGYSGNSAEVATVDVSSVGPQTGDLTINAASTGNGSLRIYNADGLSSATRVTLGLTGPNAYGYFGALQLDGARVTLNTRQGIGYGGIKVLNPSDLTIGASFATISSQSMNLNADLALRGSGGGTTLNWSGALAGSGSLTVMDALRANFTGSARNFAGDLAINGGSTLAMRDLGGFAARGASASLSMENGVFLYTGDTPGTIGAQLRLSGTANTFQSAQAGGPLAITGALAAGYGGSVVLFSPGPVTFSPTGSTYGGRLVLDGALATIGTSNAIGDLGLRVVSNSTLTIDNSLTIGATQPMDLRADLLLRGATGLQQLTWNGDISTGAHTLSIEGLQLTTAPTSNLTGAGDISLGSGGILALSGASATQRVLGNGGLLSGPGTVGEIGDGSGFNGTIQLGNGSVSGTLNATGNASLANAFVESMLYSGTGTADRLAVGGAISGLGQAAVNVIYDATKAGAPLVPANGTSQTYTILTAGTMPGTAPGTLALTSIDPLNNQFSILSLDPSNPNTTASGAQFEWITTPGAGGTAVLKITGAPNPTITGPGTTQTNIGVVNNTQLVTAVNQVGTVTQRPGQTTDAQYVGTALLLLTPSQLPGAIVTAAVAANPDALPNTTFNSMSQAGQVAKLRLMQLRDGGIGRAASMAGGSDASGAPTDPNDFGTRTNFLTQVEPAAEAVSQPLAVDAGINGASPQEGTRLWARGYGFYENVDGQSYAQGDYNASMGGVMMGADASLDSGILAGAFLGFTPGSLSIESTLGSTQTTLLGVNFGGYASWAPQSGECYMQGYAMAGYNSADQSRNIEIPGLVRTASSTANVWGAMVGGEGGLNLRVGEQAVLQPYASLEYGYYTRSSYDETGAGSMNLSVTGQDANLLQPMCGARVMQPFEIGKDKLTPFLGAAFVAQLPLGSWSESATNGFSGAQVFTYGEGADDQYGASFQAGMEFAAMNGWTAYISFNGMAMTDTTVYGGQVGINIPF